MYWEKSFDLLVKNYVGKYHLTTWPTNNNWRYEGNVYTYYIVRTSDNVNVYASNSIRDIYKKIKGGVFDEK